MPAMSGNFYLTTRYATLHTAAPHNFPDTEPSFWAKNEDQDVILNGGCPPGSALEYQTGVEVMQPS